MHDPLGMRRSTFYLLVSALILVHAAFVIAAGGSKLTFLSGGSDAPAYALLASNLLHHRGYTYAGEPTAFRPPGYPVFLALMTLIFGRFYVAATRFVQFFVCIATAWIAGRAAKILFGSSAGDVAFLLGLILPTQLFASAQILSECLATFFVSIFLYCLVRELKSPSVRNEIGMGLSAVVDAYVRFNGAALAAIGGLAVIRHRGKRRLLALGYTMLLPLLLIAPWLIRNQLVFNRKVFFSTQQGYNEVQGVLTPQGRTQPGDSTKIRASLGWVMSQIETNAPTRLALPSEAVLNKQCLAVAANLWKQEGWHALPLLARKIGYFWLSTDQAFDTASFALPERMIRLAGVVVYWGILAAAIAGWLRLRKSWPLAANMLLLYAVMYTVLHFPLVMSTRIRFPLMDPLVAMLGGGIAGERKEPEET
ncbi:MAG TPA: glycosyltransferase family 39 protein [Candidatus Aquilonibacter sp.]|nr:glycosyltransferase family 39 protein [Candidatus Aquilonibacter sp.]